MKEPQYGDLSGAVVSTDALSCQDDTAHTVLANGGDYVLQVKDNQKGVPRQCEEIVRTHWYVEAYHGKRDNGYHEDAFTRGCDVNIMAAMMVARSLGMWICARHPEMTTAQVRSDLKLHPAKLVRIMIKGGLQ